MKIAPLSKGIKKYLKNHRLEVKFDKQLELLLKNPKHRSLNVELLEPKKHGIYSFRIDRKYRVLFFYRDDKKVLEILIIILHYK